MIKETTHYHLNSINKIQLAIVLFIAMFVFLSSNAQDLESIGKRKPVKVNGGINLSTIAYGANGIDPRRDPFSYFVTGNLNFDLYELVIPVSFTYSNQSSSFQQPFNQYAIHPKYKWASADIGYVSAAYSPYTVNGHIFNGASIRLEPEGNFTYEALYGRFLKAVEFDSTNVEAEDAAFRRMGCGTKISFQHDKDYAHGIIFYARDALNSIEETFLPLELTPQENLVLSAGVGKSFLKNFLVEFEYSSSALSTDIRAGELSPEGFTVYNGLGGLFTQRASTTYNNAFKTGVSYKQEKYTVGIAYERIDPEYRTLGSYFFNNDMENITGNLTTQLYKNKINLSVNLGVQRDDLENNNVSAMKRFVGDINVAYKVSDKLNLIGAYSNFQTYTNIRSQFVDINQLTPFDNLDTLDFTQISQNASLGGNYILKSSKELRQSVNLNTSIQLTDDTQGGIEQESGSQFLMMNTSYNINITPRNLGGAIIFNVNQNKMIDVNSITFGPTLSVSKSLLDKKLRIAGSSSYNQTRTNGVQTGRFINFRLSSSYSVKKKHTFQASLTTVNRATTTGTNNRDYTEFTGNFSYTYSF